MNRKGSYQSPIHIDLSQTYWAEPLRVDVNYSISKNQTIKLANDGYKLSVKGNFGLLQYGDHMFSASEILLHHPSEHTVLILLKIFYISFLYFYLFRIVGTQQIEN
jgi:carbonic anhydrase